MTSKAIVETPETTLPASPETPGLCLPQHAVTAVPRSGGESRHAPRVPLSNTQLKDYLDLIYEADALFAAGMQEEAGRVKLMASNILRTGAPAPE